MVAKGVGSDETADQPATWGLLSIEKACRDLY